MLAPYPRRLQIPLDKVHEEVEMTTCDVIAMLGWRILGTGINRERAMGWFALYGRSGARGERAWVWLTPGREVRVFRVEHDQLRMVAIPADWFTVSS